MLNSNYKNILIIGEFPVIHKGYIDAFNNIFKKTPKAHFYLGFLNNQIIKELTELEPDIRKIPFKDIKKIINVCLPINKFFLLGKSNFSKIISSVGFSKIIILKGEKSEIFAERCLTNKKYQKIIQFYDIRLRWENKKVLEFKKRVSKISKTELEEHKKFMKNAFQQADKSKCWWRQVGSVLVKNKKVIFTAFNEMLPVDDECYKSGCIRDMISPGKLPEICSVFHSETSIVAMAAKQGISLNGTILYVTHFPCSACAKSIALSGIKKVIYSRGSSVFDGSRVMRSKGVELVKI
ncbi:MAG: deaminase [bacterium]